MAFKRALWHSGLTYETECPACRTRIRYTDYNLDFRPWFPDGFVLCPKCKKPLRHNEMLAINPDGTSNGPQVVSENTQHNPEMPKQEGKAFCSQCGKAYTPGEDKFCSGCGKNLTE